MAQGRYHLTTAEAQAHLGVSLPATRAVLGRLARQGLLAQPHRGFWVVVPPEYRALGCLPAEQFVPQLFAHLGAPYYVGLLSAAARWGAGHQQPQTSQVMVERSRPRIVCGAVSVDFIARKALREVPVEQSNTPRGFVLYSTPEATAFDVVGFPAHALGLDGAATVIAELIERLDPVRLRDAALAVPLPWVQRTGYILDVLGAERKADLLAELVLTNVRDAVALSPAAPKKGRRNERWMLDVNVKLDPDVEVLA